MPILRPQILEALRESGLAPDEKTKGIAESLDNAGLSIPATLEVVSTLMHAGASDHIKLRAAESVLKAHGLMKDQPTQLPSVNIYIQDSEAPKGINPILFPREMRGV